ncbi:MAG: Rpn family recombination-promoting nuclease/putative transposase [Oscillospiraceae bacterium]|nr:Rpn family recombination-promoting nuclease/putative transposase [Oscillospiraceae bacterium]
MATNREFKSTLFSELFNEPQRLRELYNALADTNYGEETAIEINTLDNVFFNDLKNDVSFTIGDKYVVLLEHQSTINANMPLRCLMYIARVYEKITNERAIYQEKLLEIPTPEFIILYNGEKPYPPEKTLRLSDAYKAADDAHEKFGNLDLSVRVININPGQNDNLLQKSETLSDYTSFVEHIRRNQRDGMILSEAIKEAINWGMAQDVLGTFLTKHSVEVSSMLMTEFNIDIAKEVWQEEAYESACEEFRALIADKDAELSAKDAEIASLKEKLNIK